MISYLDESILVTFNIHCECTHVWGHWDQRMFEDEFWDLDLHIFFPDMCGITTQLTKRISKRGIVLKVRAGCYNYRFKLYKRLNVATKTVVANLPWQNLNDEACYVSVLQFFSMIFIKCFENSILLSRPIGISKCHSYLFSLIHTYHHLNSLSCLSTATNLTEK